MNLIVNDNFKKRHYLALIYEKNFKKNLDNFQLKKAIYYGVKYICYIDYKNYSCDELKKLMKNCYIIEDLIGFCSIYTFENIFPIDKIFDGEKYQMKDYFSTLDYLKDKDYDKLILEFGVDDFLSNYGNNQIIDFQVRKFMLCDAILKKEGKPSLMERFSEEFNIPYYNKINENTLINPKTGEKIQIEERKNNKRIPYIFNI